ncbi:hypothetical protein H4R34_000222 [Dimargaris verticillata]|uniref:Attractin/MKLN-like beta-propeller domain-containing protein n=1 Tax=Dimargaris verticillata TaxID=2761393 RepID=A0A9W8EBJ2_9FUNG|nr:hypothetical protein H4R34_000222 [Dimargaris verticillata]
MASASFRWLVWLVLAVGYAVTAVQARLYSFQHSAVYYDKRIYLFGGRSKRSNARSGFLTHDYSLYVGRGFSTHSASWEATFVERNERPRVAGNTAMLIRHDDQPVVVVSGGDGPTTEVAQSPFVAYHLKSKYWTRWGIDTTRSWATSAVYAPSINRILYFGGLEVDKGSPIDGTESSQLNLFNPQTLAWTQPNYASTVPEFLFGRYQHGAAMLNETHMVVVGGCTGDSLVDPATVHMYDTVHAVWTEVEAVDAWFPGLKLFGIASYMGKIIITGGVTDMRENDFFGDVAVLDTTQNPWRWRRPPLPKKEKLGMDRYGHSSVLIGRYLVSSMGVLFTDVKDGDNVDEKKTEPIRNDEPSDKDQIVVLDVASWKTVEWFDLDEALQGPVDPVNRAMLQLAEGTPGLSVGAIIGIVIGGLGFLAALIAGVWYCRRRRRRRQRQYVHQSSFDPNMSSGLATLVGSDLEKKAKPGPKTSRRLPAGAEPGSEEESCPDSLLGDQSNPSTTKSTASKSRERSKCTRSRTRSQSRPSDQSDSDRRRHRSHRKSRRDRSQSVSHKRSHSTRAEKAAKPHTNDPELPTRSATNATLRRKSRRHSETHLQRRAKSDGHRLKSSKSIDAGQARQRSRRPKRSHTMLESGTPGSGSNGGPPLLPPLQFYHDPFATPQLMHAWYPMPPPPTAPPQSAATPAFFPVFPSAQPKPATRVKSKPSRSSSNRLRQ